MDPPFGSFKNERNEMDPLFEENEISVIKHIDELWFRAKDIAKALEYEKTCNAVLKHVEDEDKSSLEDIRRGPQE